MGVKEIQDNMEKSFKGTFKNAMKNGYDLDTHYVIVDWKFFHELLKKEDDALVENSEVNIGQRGDRKISSGETSLKDTTRKSHIPAHSNFPKSELSEHSETKLNKEGK